MRDPFIVGIGGTLRPHSSSEQALAIALKAAERRGARTELLAGEAITLPFYDPITRDRSGKSRMLISALRSADGVIICSPCYHGGLSGLVKNALDYLEDLRGDERPYLDGRAVGTIVCGHGYQGLGTVLGQLRSIVHALRGWPVPLGVGVNSQAVRFTDGICSDSGIGRQLEIMAAQVVDFARMRIAHADTHASIVA